MPVERIRPPSGGLMPKSVSASSVRPEPSRPVMPSTSPWRSVKLTSSNSPRRDRLSTSSSGWCAPCRGRDGVLDLEAGHQLGDAPLVDLGRRRGADLAAVAHDRDALGDLARPRRAGG